LKNLNEDFAKNLPVDVSE